MWHALGDFGSVSELYLTLQRRCDFARVSPAANKEEKRWGGEGGGGVEINIGLCS
jgi:hypothetical protein